MGRNGRVNKHDISFDDDMDPTTTMFWEALNGKPDALSETSKASNEKAEFEAMMANHENLLLHVTNESGQMEINEVQRGNLDRGILEQEQDDVIIVDVGRVIYVWIGPQCNKEEIGEAMYFAQAHLAKCGRPMWTPITRVIHGAEPANFWKCFGCDH